MAARSAEHVHFLKRPTPFAFCFAAARLPPAMDAFDFHWPFARLPPTYFTFFAFFFLRFFFFLTTFFFFFFFLAFGFFAFFAFGFFAFAAFFAGFLAAFFFAAVLVVRARTAPFLMPFFTTVVFAATIGSSSATMSAALSRLL